MAKPLAAVTSGRFVQAPLLRLRALVGGEEDEACSGVLLEPGKRRWDLGLLSNAVFAHVKAQIWPVVGCRGSAQDQQSARCSPPPSSRAVGDASAQFALGFFGISVIGKSCSLQRPKDFLRG